MKKYTFLLSLLFLNAIRVCGQTKEIDILKDSFQCETINACIVPGDIDESISPYLELSSKAPQYGFSSDVLGKRRLAIYCIIGREWVYNTYYFKVIYNKKVYYAQMSRFDDDLEIVAKLDSVIKTDHNYEKLIKKSFLMDANFFNDEKSDMKEEFAKLSKTGILVTNFDYDYQKYSSYPDVSIEILNPSNKTIKYTWFTVVAKNAVKDVIATKVIRGIGPIKYLEKGSYSFETVFYSKVVDDILLKSIKIQYMDGTFKEISSGSKSIVSKSFNDCIEMMGQ